MGDKSHIQKIRQLEKKISQQDAHIAMLEGGDMASEEKLKNINKMHAQKVRALMNSIQELKKEVATAKHQNKDHKRSDMIDKLKKEIIEQDLIIKVLRKTVGNDTLCDNVIIDKLSEGPKRNRPPSREELRIEIKNLKSKLAQATAKRNGNQAAADLDKLFPDVDVSVSSISSFRNVDTLHNEKIVDLLETVENLKVEISSRDMQIEYLKKQMEKVYTEVKQAQNRDVEVASMLSKNNALENEANSIRNELSQTIVKKDATETQFQEQELSTQDMRAKLQATVDQAQKERQRQGEQLRQRDAEKNALKETFDLEKYALNEEISRLMHDISEVKAHLKDKERQIKNAHKDTEADRLAKALDTKQTEVAKLQVDISAKDMLIQKLDDEIMNLKRRIEDANFDDNEVEIVVLRKKVGQLTEANGIPANYLTVEQEKTESYRKKAIELRRQVADLQAELEDIQDARTYDRKKSSAIYLLNKRGIDVNDFFDDKMKIELIETKKTVQEKEYRVQQLEGQLRELDELRNDYIRLDAKYNEELERNKLLESMDDYIGRDRDQRKTSMAPQLGQFLVKGGLGKPTPTAGDQPAPQSNLVGGLVSKDKFGEISAMETGVDASRQGRLTTTYGFGPSPRKRIGTHIMNKMQNTISDAGGLTDLKDFNNVKKFNASRTIVNRMGTIFSRKPKPN